MSVPSFIYSFYWCWTLAASVFLPWTFLAMFREAGTRAAHISPRHSHMKCACRIHITPNPHLKITSPRKMVSPCDYRWGWDIFICLCAIHVSSIVKSLCVSLTHFPTDLPFYLIGWIIMLCWFYVFQTFSSFCQLGFSLF